MSNPNPEAFARLVLWHLTGLEARVQEIQMRLIRLEQTAGIHNPEAESALTRHTSDLHKRLFLEAVAEAQLPEPPTS